MTDRPTIAPALLAALVLAACGSDHTALAIEAQCNPLGAGHCMTPWPSSAFEIDDATTITGRRLAIPEGTLPATTEGLATDPAGWNQADGFSPSAPMVMAWKGGISPEGLPPPDNFDLSLTAESPTVILDMTTGTRVPHFAELDAQADDQPDSQALLLRPAARLLGGHRYAVAITTAVHAKDGSDLEVPPGFAALRDHKSTDHALLETLRPRFAEVLAALDTAGIAEDRLVLAWDFTVASDEAIHRDLIAARDRTVAALDAHPIAFTVTSDAPIGDGKDIAHKLTGTLDAPLFLTAGGAASIGTKIARDVDGLPALQGFYQIPFTAIVPTCAYAAAAPVGMVIYGHGLLGSAGETAGTVQQATAKELCAVLVGTDMRGMSTADLAVVSHALTDLTRTDEVMEVLEQGVVNHITLVRAMRTSFAKTLFVDAMSGHAIVDPTKVSYYGLSQGGIMGATVMAYEPTMTRAVLGVGGGNYSTLLERSADWTRYRQIVKRAYPDPLDVELAVGLFQMRWDKTEGAGVANSVLAGAATGVPPKQILMQNALGDHEVPNLASYWMARTMGIPILSPTPATPWGLTVQPSPLAAGASAMVLMDGGAPPAPLANLPATDLDMHDLTRKQPASRRQIKAFFETGAIVNQCDGACVCQAGACE